jgi:hypothetical protein
VILLTQADLHDQLTRQRQYSISYKLVCSTWSIVHPCWGKAHAVLHCYCRFHSM